MERISSSIVDSLLTTCHRQERHQQRKKNELIVQREHYELARSGHARFAAARAHWDQPTLRYRLIEGDSELLPGLTLLETGGHAPGHQSVLVRLPQTGRVLLAIDAVVQQRLFTPDRRAWPDDENEEQLRASTRKLLDVVEREYVALVIFGHDGQQWQSLKKAPATCVAQAGQHLQLATLHACVGQQSLTLGMNDSFFFALIACAVCAIATLFVGRDPALQEARAAKKRDGKGEESAPMTVMP
jgi:hypothetical protein